MVVLRPRKAATQQPDRPQRQKPRKPFPLLSLPALVRRLVWQYVAGFEPVELYGLTFRQGAPFSVDKLGAMIRRRKGREKRQLFSLSWLRTNRMIYEDAKSVVLSSITLQFSEQIYLSRFLEVVPKSTKDLIRSVDFGVGIDVQLAGFDQITLSSSSSQGWETFHRGCCCPLCFHLGAVRSLDQLPSVRTLRLSILFTCQSTRSLRATVQEANRKLRELDKVPPFMLVESPGWKQKMNELCSRSPMSFYYADGLGARSRGIRNIEAKVCLDHIAHYRSTSKKSCWCYGRTVDEDSLRKLGFASNIEHRLLEGRESTEQSL